MDEFARDLAQCAHELGLDARNVDCASPEQLRAFAQAALEELAARGLVTGSPEIGCWAAPRSGKN